MGDDGSGADPRCRSGAARRCRRCGAPTTSSVADAGRRGRPPRPAPTRTRPATALDGQHRRRPDRPRRRYTVTGERRPARCAVDPHQVAVAVAPRRRGPAPRTGRRGRSSPAAHRSGATSTASSSVSSVASPPGAALVVEAVRAGRRACSSTSSRPAEPAAHRRRRRPSAEGGRQPPGRGRPCDLGSPSGRRCLDPDERGAEHAGEQGLARLAGCAR